MLVNVDDVRIKALRPLLPPAILLEEVPASEPVSKLVAESRRTMQRIMRGDGDGRLAVVVGPCSIHDPEAALDYARRLVELAARHREHLFIMMRVYFEKPRTTVGWKGLINDPYLDNSFQINQGLRVARTLLLRINELGLPCGTEFLDTIIPQFLADLVSWAAIGARTSESQIHRELSSGLSMPVGFKNGTGGNVQLAVDATRSSRSPHWFPSVTKQGVAAIFETAGNDGCHIILRGGSRTGPNFGEEAIDEAVGMLRAAGQPEVLMVDCSHANSQKRHEKQLEVGAELARQIASGSRAIGAVMIESNLVEGRQELVAGGQLLYGQSVTDACISLEQTEGLLDKLAQAVARRRQSGHSADA